MRSAAEIRAELEVVELEEQLVAAKATGDASRELKLRVREARQRYRELRGGGVDVIEA